MDEPRRVEDPHRRRDRTGDRREREHGESGEQRPATTERVTERANQDLTDGESEDACGQGELDARHRRLELVGDRRQRRQVDVRRERPECGQRPEDDQQSRAGRSQSPIRTRSTQVDAVMLESLTRQPIADRFDPGLGEQRPQREAPGPAPTMAICVSMARSARTMADAIELPETACRPPRTSVSGP